MTKKQKSERVAYAKPGVSFLDWLGAFGTDDIGVDLGTSNVVVYIKKKGQVFPESSAVAIRERTGEIFACGTKAEEMEGHAPKSIRIVYPMRESAIVDYRAAAHLLNSVINRSYIRSLFFQPRIVMSVPAGVSGVQRRALLEAAVTMGVRKAVLVDQPVAALMGMGLDTDRMQGAMIVDLGGGSAKISVVSARGIVVSDAVFGAGLAMDQAIMMRVREKYRVMIGRQAAETVKKQLGIRWDIAHRMEATETAGRSLVTGLPMKVGITSEDVAEALRPCLEGIYKKILAVLQKTPPALLADVRDHGIILSGGLALLAGLDRMVTRMTGIPAFVAEDAPYVNAIGAGRALDYIDYLRDSMQELQ